MPVYRLGEKKHTTINESEDQKREVLIPNPCFGMLVCRNLRHYFSNWYLNTLELNQKLNCITTIGYRDTEFVVFKYRFFGVTIRNWVPKYLTYIVSKSRFLLYMNPDLGIIRLTDVIHHVVVILTNCTDCSGLLITPPQLPTSD